MKKYCTIFLLVFAIGLGYSQNHDFKKYSYTELFEMIKAEQDSVFRLSNAAIVVDSLTDKRFTIFPKSSDDPISESVLGEIDSIVIDRHIFFKNVHFEDGSSFVKMKFLKAINFENSIPPKIYHSTFNHHFYLGLTDNVNMAYNNMFHQNLRWHSIYVLDNNFNGSVDIDINAPINNNGLWRLLSLQFNYNVVNGSMLVSRAEDYFEFEEKTLIIQIENCSPANILGNKFNLTNYNSRISQLENKWTHLKDNTFQNGSLDLIFGGNIEYTIENNEFPEYVIVMGNLKNEYKIQWDNFSHKLLDKINFQQFQINLDSISLKKLNLQGDNADIIKFKTDRFKDKNVFEKTQIRYSSFLNHYKNIGSKISYNEVYVELKDLETEYLKEQYKIDPSFDTFFTYRVNQFLKVFSVYGTKPSKSIIFSLYVILLFASIYLFFPNSWDKHGKKRIVNRYSFFFKYMNKKAGIHEVYLDEQKEELMEYDEFKTMITNSGQTVPKFFKATALPLYKWAISGTKLTASFLKRVDIMKGKWQELPKNKRIWKSILLVGAFIIAVSYDLYIKILNALMLSINTFTTLGFGEIPLKGLPRYLAIIQGFIGWFMLTIFSVSLISQLLN